MLPTLTTVVVHVRDRVRRSARRRRGRFFTHACLYRADVACRPSGSAAKV